MKHRSLSTFSFWVSVVFLFSAQAFAQSTAVVLLDDFDKQPLQGDNVYYYTGTNGDRGTLGQMGSVVVGNGFVRATITSSSGTYLGQWASFNHPIREKLPLNFSAIFPSQILPQFQPRVTAIRVHIRDGQGAFHLELQAPDFSFPFRANRNLSGGEQTFDFALPTFGKILNYNWFVQGSAGAFVVVDRIEMVVTVPDLSTAQKAFLFSYAMLLDNFVPETGLTRDRASFPAGAFDNSAVTGLQAANAVMAYRLGFISIESARYIVERSTEGLLAVPTYHGLWPHFVLNGTQIVPDTEWSSVDTMIGLINLWEARQYLLLDSVKLESFLRSIDWQDLTLPDGSISHGYDFDGQRLTSSWRDLGTESFVVDCGYSAVTGKVAPMNPPPAYGPGFISEMAWLFMTPPDKDIWGVDWKAYRQADVDRQIAHYRALFGDKPLFGASAGEVPVPSEVSKALIYLAAGLGGFVPDNDGTAHLGYPAVWVHYSAMVASLRPAESTAMWQWLMDHNLFTPLNNVESLLFDGNKNVKWNDLKGSLNLAFQSLGWARMLVGENKNHPLYKAFNEIQMLKEGYDLLVQIPAPVADFSASVTQGDALLTVSFTDASTGSVTGWTWNFGDGNTSTDQNPSHTYASAGSYTVKLTVTGPGGSNTQTKTDLIIVTTPPPTANFSTSTTSGNFPLPVAFTDASTGSINSWAWDFGDGALSTEQNPKHTYASAGSYTVKLTITGPGGSNVHTKANLITVTTPPPTANFTLSATSGNFPLTVAFTDASTGSVSGWQWDFGDGNTSTDQNPSHIYSSAGNFTVKLTVTGPGGSNTQTKDNMITVTTPAPTANFSTSATNGNFPLTVSFTDVSTGNVTGWQWDFGDGSLSTDQNPSHTYANAGTFTVKLTVTGPGGSNTQTKTGLITVTTPPPVANFSVSSNNGNFPLTVSFTDVSTGNITGWQWDFGDGNTSTDQNPSHIYSSAGNFTVKLTVTGPGGSNSQTKDNLISVTTPPPTANFSTSTTSGNVPLTVVFTDASTGSVTGWQWDFGDGNTSTEQNPSHTYTTAGTYTVKLTVTGPGGINTQTKDNLITVTTPPPTANFTLSATSGNFPLTVAFTDVSTGNVTGWQWDFGDGNTSTDQNPSHTYATAGTYTVKLTVTGPGGSNTQTKSNLITVTTPPPVALSDTVKVHEDIPIEFRLKTSGIANSTTFQIVKNPVHGNLKNNLPVLIYTPDENYNGIDSLLFSVQSSEGHSSFATIYLVIEAVNDLPVVVRDSISTQANTPVTLQVLANDSDDDGDTLKVIAVGLPTSGTAVVNFEKTITYTPKSGFSGVVHINYTVSDGHAEVSAEVVVVVFLSQDFDGDGVVGFSDFILFAQIYGSVLGDQKYDAKFDLDGSGDIGFADFLSFAASFGKSVGKPARLSRPVVDLTNNTRLSLAMLPGCSPNGVTVAVKMVDVEMVKGYSLNLNYDPSILMFEGASESAQSVFAKDGEVAIQMAVEPGQVLLSDVFREEELVKNQGELVRLFFKVLNATSNGRVEVAEALLAHGDGGITQLGSAGLEGVRALPSDYLLGQNFPNPFNPETVVPFSLPELGVIHLSIFSILGQEIAILVDGPMQAGNHQIVWNGRDFLGHPVGSGVYFIRMKAGGISIVRRMVLLK